MIILFGICILVEIGERASLAGIQSTLKREARRVH